MAHLHSVYDTDQHFKIDAITREIINQAERKNKLMQFDHNSERFTFELPRYVDGHDMTLSNQIRIHYINAGSARQQSKDVYPVYDMQLSPNDSKTVIFSWLISQNATKYAGTLNFLVQFSCVGDDGIVEYSWHTEIFKGITVSAGMSNNENVVAQVSDIVAQWEQELFGIGDSEQQKILNTSTEQQAEIEAKAALALSSIPGDYTSVYNMADESVRTKADAIVQTMSGEYVVTHDSSEDPLRGLRVFGKSTQADIPTPDNPQVINSIGNVSIGIYGKNLFNESYAETESKTVNGVTFVLNPDMSITVDGTATEAALFNLMILYEVTPVVRPGATYIIGGATSNVALQVYEWQNTWVQCASTSSQKQFTLSKNAAGILVRYVVNPGISVDNVTIRPTLYVIENADTAYEKPAAGQVLKCASVSALCGIPVSSGGNYTDSNGQQWICDEIDLARGVYVQRVKRLVLNGSETWRKSDSYLYIDLDEHAIKGGKGFCSHFVYWYNYGGDCIFASEKWVYLGSITSANYDVDTWKEFLSENNVTLLYILAEPIETALTNEEIFNFSQLHSNYSNTTILNDVGAWMEVSYNADTKIYLRNEAEDITATILEEISNGTY